ncbi:MarR family winged helix-turn-helix transcriptional regulator [Brevibacillus reuszeri]|uniref:MarR family winged helix-turn-helix transcriptional regulator n=1 Tax=Brevibacillus reuszeri TaxID=54915 RepID=UPI0028A1E733|nr:MarR family winged helix-turn-helix transcriptional regulator [Brevibacillus reuszeri]
MDQNDVFYKFVAFTASLHRVTHELTRDARPDSITPVQYSILEHLAVSQPVTPSQLSDCLHISMPNTSRELRKLTEKQLIEKVEDHVDRRKHYIRLSKEGQHVMDEAFAGIKARFFNLIEHASPEDVEEMKRALDVLQKHLFQ